jgi:hypothetical protein
MLGFDEKGKNSYLVYVPKLKQIIRSKNVRFDEGVNYERQPGEVDKSMLHLYKELIINDPDDSPTILENFNFFEEKDSDNYMNYSNKRVKIEDDLESEDS